jgi:CO/xanthine dehydrogenase FAD-binding subunit
MAISVVNVAFVYSKNDDTFKHLKIAAGAVAPTVVLLDSFASAFLKTHENVLGLLQLIEKDISPIDDIRATASYRKKVLANLVKHFLSGQVS